jgi:hypothetical protein
MTGRVKCYDALASLHQGITVRTTLDLTDTALEAARQLATHRAQSLGTVVSELILKGLHAGTPMARKTGFPVFAGGAGKTITLDDVKSAEDEP